MIRGLEIIPDQLAPRSMAISGCWQVYNVCPANAASPKSFRRVQVTRDLFIGEPAAGLPHRLAPRGANVKCLGFSLAQR